MLERVPKYTLRKLSVGLASVMIGSGILMNSPKVLADTINQNKGVQPSSQIEDKRGKSVTEAATTTVNNKESENELKLAKASGGAPASATTTNAEEKVVATKIQDTTQDKDKQPNANETTQNTTNIDKKDTEVTLTTPATPKKTAAPVALTAMKVASKVNALAAPKAMKPAATAETPDPTVPDKSANTAIINNRSYLFFC